MSGSVSAASAPLTTGGTRDAILDEPCLHVLADQKADKVDGFGRSIFANRKTIAAAESVRGIARAARDGREGEPAQRRIVFFTSVALPESAPGAHCPIISCRLAVRHHVPDVRDSRREETFLERFQVNQLLQVFSALTNAGSANEPLRA